MKIKYDSPSVLYGNELIIMPVMTIIFMIRVIIMTMMVVTIRFMREMIIAIVITAMIVVLIVPIIIIIRRLVATEIMILITWEKWLSKGDIPVCLTIVFFEIY